MLYRIFEPLMRYNENKKTTLVTFLLQHLNIGKPVRYQMLQLFWTFSHMN